MKLLLHTTLVLFTLFTISSCFGQVRTNKSCDVLEKGDDIYIKPGMHNWLRVYYLVEVSTEGYEEWANYDHYYKPETRPKTGLVMKLGKRYSRKAFLNNKTSWTGKCNEVIEKKYPVGSFSDSHGFSDWIELDISNELTDQYLELNILEKLKTEGKLGDTKQYVRLEDVLCSDSYNDFEELK